MRGFRDDNAHIARITAWVDAPWRWRPPVSLAAVLLAVPAQAGEADRQPTFAKDVAPILQRSCETCHRADGGAPMALATYGDVRPWARAIKDKTSRPDNDPERMPPWFIEKNVGVQRFKNDISLNRDEVALIAEWVDAGAPRGNPADMPPPIDWPDGSHVDGGRARPDRLLARDRTSGPTAPTGGAPWGRSRPA